MFLVFNKDKIMAFVIACSTVFALFLMTSFFAKIPENTVETSTPIQNSQTIENKEEKTINLIHNETESKW